MPPGSLPVIDEFALMQCRPLEHQALRPPRQLTLTDLLQVYYASEALPVEELALVVRGVD